MINASFFYIKQITIQNPYMNNLKYKPNDALLYIIESCKIKSHKFKFQIRWIIYYNGEIQFFPGTPSLSRKSSSMRGRPSRSLIFGSHPSNSLAFVMSGFLWRGSSGVFSTITISTLGLISCRLHDGSISVAIITFTGNECSRGKKLVYSKKRSCRY